MKKNISPASRTLMFIFIFVILFIIIVFLSKEVNPKIEKIEKDIDISTLTNKNN